MTLQELGIEDKFETRQCEFKKELNEKECINWLKTVDAFANTSGGKLYVGVDDSTLEVIGFNQKGIDRQVQIFIRCLKEHFKVIPPYSFSYIPFKMKDEEKYLICIQIDKGSRLPIFLTYQGYSLTFVRDEGRTSPAREDQIQDMVISSSAYPYDYIPTEEVFSPSNFSTLYSTYKNNNGKELNEKVLSSIEFFSLNKTLTRGALLFKDGYASSLTRVKCIKWPGLDKGSSLYLDEKTIDGNIVECIYKCQEYISSASVKGFKKENDKRVEVFSFPPRAVFEGLVNAFAHRNYFMDYMNIQIDIYLDRLEITSPGSLLNNENLYKDKDITKLAPIRRNKLICAVLEKLKMMEAIGSGFKKIEDEYRDKGDNFSPYVSATSSYFVLTLPNLLFSSGIVNESTTDLKLSYLKRQDYKDRDDKVLSYCYYSPKSLEEIASMLNIKPSSYLRNDLEDRLGKQSLLIVGEFGNKKKYSTNRSLVTLMNNF